MVNSIQSIELGELIGHPDNPNRQSKANFAKLKRNIKETGRYEPLVVRLHPTMENRFEIINGHHRSKALFELGYERADCVVWEVDDQEVDILLATLNRLGGSDELVRKLALLKRLNKKVKSAELGKLLPQTARQIEQLVNFKRPVSAVKAAGKCLANPLVFFVDDSEQQIVEEALSLVEKPKKKMSKAA